jgi:hypothetical protein
MRVALATSNAAPRRVDLIFYCAEQKKEYRETPRWAALSHDQNTWLSFGHTLPKGNPPTPFWASEILDALLFMPTIVQRDEKSRRTESYLEIRFISSGSSNTPAQEMQSERIVPDS